MPKVTLEQWRVVKAVAEHGGFNRAAEALFKSPSTLNHAVHKLQNQLGVEIFTVAGRKVRLTDAGMLLLRRASRLLEQAGALEEVAAGLARGEEAEVALAVDQIFPRHALARALERFSERLPHIRMQLHETVLNGGVEMLYNRRVDLLISGLAAQGFLGEPIVTVNFLAVAHPDHPLHRLERPLELRDLAHHRQLVVRDSAQRQSMDAGWLKAEQRWTVGHLSTSLEMVRLGLGFAWLPENVIGKLLATGEVKALPLSTGGIRTVPMQLFYAEADAAGPGARLLAQLLHEEAQRCAVQPNASAGDSQAVSTDGENSINP